MCKIGWIGLGNMGAPMCRNLIKAGYDVTVWNRTESKADGVIKLGAKWAASPAEVTSNADYIFTMVSNGKILEKLVLGTGGIIENIAAGKVLIDMSTVSPDESLRVSEAVEAAGGRFLSCPVTGSVVPAEKGTLGLLVSGEKSLFEEVKPVLAKLGKNMYWLGEKAEACVMKIALNTMVGNTTQILAEAVVLAEKAGISVEKATEVIAGSAVGNLIVDSKIGIINANKYDVAFSVDMMLKDFDLASEILSRFRQWRQRSRKILEMLRSLLIMRVYIRLSCLKILIMIHGKIIMQRT